MRRIGLTLTLGLALTSVLLGSGLASAGERHVSVAPPSYAEVAAKGPQAILEVTDSIHFGYRTMWVDAELRVFASGETKPKVIHQIMYQDGPKRMIRILAPPEIKGMGVLIKNPETMYVYVPEFDKVRRVASHARTQTFVGSDFNYTDMAMGALSPEYVAALESETEEEVVLLLTKREDRDPPYPKMRIFISKANLQMRRQEYFDAEDKHVRTQERSAMKTFESEDYGVQSMVIITDHTNRDHRTELHMSGFRAMHDIPSGVFSKRTLVRGGEEDM